MSEKYSAEWWRAKATPRTTHGHYVGIHLGQEACKELAAREEARDAEVKRLKEAMDRIASLAELPACDYPGASEVVRIARAALEGK